MSRSGWAECPSGHAYLERQVSTEGVDARFDEGVVACLCDQPLLAEAQQGDSCNGERPAGVSALRPVLHRGVTVGDQGFAEPAHRRLDLVLEHPLEVAP